MGFLTYGNTSDPCSLLIHHLIGMMDPFCHAPFVVASYASNLPQAAIFMSPDYVEHGSQS